MILPITDLKKGLLSFLRQQRPRGKEGNVLVHYGLKIEETNFVALIDPLITNQNKVFYFNRPEESLAILACEEAYSVRINGNNKFSILGDRIATISKKLISNLNNESFTEIPLFLGGTKFSSEKNSEEWKNFADNDWFIPEFLLYKRGKDQWLIINYFIDNDHSVVSLEHKIDCFLQTICKLSDEEDSLSRTISLQYSISQEEKVEWNKLVSDALSKIAEGLFRKIVISRRLLVDIEPSPLFQDVMIKLQENYKNCTVFLYKSDNSIFFGATPEQLLKFRNNEIEFDALAGSAKRGIIDEDDNIIACNLLKDNKNIEEHNYVIEFIKEASSKYVNNLRQFDTGIKKFSNIQHIYTPIKAELNSYEQIYKLVDEIFPTPAICGSPKDISFNFINEYERFDRGLFSGIIGYISPEEMDLVVAIRSALLIDNKLYIYSGCGIVKGSDPASEFEETEIKMKPILSIFNED
ncbi:MAG: isochorismate synthase [Ignavibacteriaceae bacterium]|nr:isochorismate synthase [Ignavibacteriaceae bacterium]